MTPVVKAVLDAMPAATRARAELLRDMILGVADSLPEVAALEETVKWGEAAFLPGRAGTTVRIGWDRESGDCKLLVHCQTSLVETWRDRFAGRLSFEGNRAVRVPLDGSADEAALQACVAEALTCHAARRRAQ